MYSKPRILTEPVSNNRLNFDERTNHEIVIPALIEGTIDDVEIGEHVAIECEVDGQIVCGKGLKNFVFLKNARVPTWIMDNHNHAFYFWHEALMKGWIQKGSFLVHIDQHTDLATPSQMQKTKCKRQNEGNCNTPPGHVPTILMKEVGGIKGVSIESEKKPSFGILPFELCTMSEVYTYTNEVLTIADFIVPALADGIISEAVMVTGEDIQTSRSYVWEKQKAQLKKQNDGSFFNKNPLFGILPFEFGTPQSLIVDLDLDYFSQGFDEAKCLETVRYWLARADIITIATSPLFIDQEEALRMLGKIF